MKFWRQLLSGERRERRSGSCVRSSTPSTPSSVPTRRRSSSSRGSSSSLYEDSCGTTFVELIKRPGTHLGVIVTGGRDTGLKPRIADLVSGSLDELHECCPAGVLAQAAAGAPAG